MSDVSKDALLSDVCISTSAAPTYLPGHQFETTDKDGKPRTFNLIDGGVAANNPVGDRPNMPRATTCIVLDFSMSRDADET